MVKYVDNENLIGWYFYFDGEYFGDGTKENALHLEKLFNY